MSAMNPTTYSRAHQIASETTVGLLSARASGEATLAATLLKDYLDELEAEGLDLTAAFSRGWMSAVSLLDKLIAATADPEATRRELAVDIARARS